MNAVEEYAIWLAHTGVNESARNDPNEQVIPITNERGEPMTVEDWRAAMTLAHQIAAWIRGNPGTLLGLVRGEVTG